MQHGYNLVYKDRLDSYIDPSPRVKHVYKNFQFVVKRYQWTTTIILE
jgi:hypothetical protein